MLFWFHYHINISFKVHIIMEVCNEVIVTGDCVLLLTLRRVVMGIKNRLYFPDIKIILSCWVSLKSRCWYWLLNWGFNLIFLWSPQHLRYNIYDSLYSFFASISSWCWNSNTFLCLFSPIDLEVMSYISLYS